MTTTLTEKLNALWRIVDAVGGAVIIDDFDRGWNAAISSALKELEKCGFSEGKSDAADMLKAQAAEIEQLVADCIAMNSMAYQWMAAHDNLKAGIPVKIPSPVRVPELAARATAAEAKVAALTEVLEEIRDHSANQDMSHKDFRVAAYHASDAALGAAS